MHGPLDAGLSLRSCSGSRAGRDGGSAHKLGEHPIESQLKPFGGVVGPLGDLAADLVDPLVADFGQSADAVEHLAER